MSRGRRKRRPAPRVTSPKMDFAPLFGFGYLPNGPQDQAFQGWKIFAYRPDVHATPVVVLTRDEYEALTKSRTT